MRILRIPQPLGNHDAVHQHIKFQHTRETHGRIIYNIANFPGLFLGATKEAIVPRGGCNKLQQIWAGHRMIIGTDDIRIRLRYTVPFQNEGDSQSKATGVEN